MGISDEDRMKYIFRRVSDIYALHAQFDTAEWRKSICAVRDFIPGIWHAMLGSEYYRHWWSAGCGAGIFEETKNPWFQAILSQVEEENEGTQNKGWEMGERPWWSVEMFLPLHERLVFMAYAHTGTLTYALRRYDDALLRKFANLDVFVSELQGRCVMAFREYQSFARAQMVADLLSLIGEEHPALKEENIKYSSIVHTVQESVQGYSLTLKEVLAIDLAYRGGARTLSDGFSVIQQLMVGTSFAPVHRNHVSLYFIRELGNKLGIDPVKVQEWIDRLPKDLPQQMAEDHEKMKARADRKEAFLRHAHAIRTTPRYGTQNDD